jgi:hypothetical protein
LTAAKTNSPPSAQRAQRKTESALFNILLQSFKICKQTSKLSAVSANSAVHLSFLPERQDFVAKLMQYEKELKNLRGLCELRGDSDLFAVEPKMLSWV